ncbi:MAG TPA: SNF2-related protein [Nocardioides sp.]|nr:SNF2-related protein [Nocardioides sp.]
MSFVPLVGPATFRPADPPRDSRIEFSGAARRVELPVRAALPALSRSRQDPGAHPSVALLAASALLATRLVGAGRIAPADGSWRVEGLDERDRESIELLARARTYDDLDPVSARAIVEGMVAAVADALPRAAPVPRQGRAEAGRDTVAKPDEGFARRVQERVAARASARRGLELPELVRISLRVEADEEELAAGGVRLVLQVHDEQDPLHVCEAALLFAPVPAGGLPEHGFGPRARIHAGIALRSAAEVWPVLDRFLALAVPDEIALDGAEVSSLLEHVGDLRDAQVDVHWPRALGRELTTRAVLDQRVTPRDKELPLQDGMFGEGALFEFSWQVALHGDPLTEAELAELASAASPILKLRGAWTVVDPSTAVRARKRLIRRASGADALAAALTGVAEVPAGPGEVPLAEQVIVGASLLRVREDLLTAASREPLPAPKALRAELRDYQRHGLTWLADLTRLGLGGCLADDMGLGKTITLIALHLHRLEAGLSGGRPTLVVCPASLLGNWQAEIERFAPGVRVARFHGSARELPETGFALTTYGTLRRSVDALADVPWDLVVADEAQHVKNSRTATARALRRLPGSARVALTGTPVENDLAELWSILDWTVPGLLGSRLAFRRRWAAPIESGVDANVTRQFADLIGPFLLRRRKSDPGIAPELPPKTETEHLLGLTREQVVLYEAFVKDTLERIEFLPADDPGRRGLVLALLTGLKQICNHPAQFLKESGGRGPRLRGRSEKLELLDELIGTVLSEGGAVLVFTQYVAMARLIERHLAASGVPHQFLHGQTPVPEREAMVRRFQDGEVPVFLLSLKAGGTGLNLTRADHVVHFDRWWNPAVEDQATDRAYRIGQTQPVQVHKLVVRGTVEERVAELLRRKRSLADSVLARGEAALTELGNEDLRDLVTLQEVARREAYRAALDGTDES